MLSVDYEVTADLKLKCKRCGRTFDSMLALNDCISSHGNGIVEEEGEEVVHPVSPSPVGGFSLDSAFSGDSDVTSQKILSDMKSIDKNLGMITKIRSPLNLSVVETGVIYFRYKGYEPLAKFFEGLVESIRVNECSRKGWRADQIFKAYVAVALEELRMKDSALDNPFGVKRK